jgi:hydrogenase large subunit
MKRITIDPVTRIEGHLRVDCEVDQGRISKAWSSGTMWRGIETILTGRDPRDAWVFTQRICGVCTTVHAIASVRAVENALKIQVPKNAQYIRNLLIAAHALHDHIVHFYQLSALDWVDVTGVLKADPAKASAIAESISPWRRNSKAEMTAVKEKVKSFVEKGQLGIFTNGYWGHPAMKLAPEVNLLAVSHYLQALDIQRKANQVVAILGSKTPNIQNLAVGGVANAINLDSPSALNMEKLYQVKDLLEEVVTFVQQVYFPDVCAIGGMYADWTKYGAGVTNYLAVPDLPLDEAGTKFDLPGGTIMGGDLASMKPITSFTDKYFEENVSESIAHSYYEGSTKLHPYKGETKPKFTGWKEDKQYSWVKSPRFKDAPMQVGPLAQVLVGLAQGHEGITRWGTKCLEVAGSVAGRPALHHRPPRGARDPVRRPRRAGAQALEAAGRERGQGRHGGLQRPEREAEEGELPGVRLPRGAPRRPLALDRHRGRQDQELPVRRALDLERGSPRRERQARPLRGVARREPDGRPGEAARGAPDHPLLRSVPRVRHPHARRGRQGDLAGEGAVAGKFKRGRSGWTRPPGAHSGRSGGSLFPGYN